MIKGYVLLHPVLEVWKEEMEKWGSPVAIGEGIERD